MKKALILLFFFLPAVFGVSITEIMYNPEGKDSDFEYVELYGNEDISGWYFEGIDLTFPENTTIAGYIILASTPFKEGEENDFFDRYGKNASFEFSGSLLNSGEALILRDSKDKIKEVVVYDDWGAENYSLERKEIERYSSDPLNWHAVLGGSPGESNQKLPCSWNIRFLVNESLSEKPSWSVVGELSGVDTAVLHHKILTSEGEVEKEYASSDVDSDFETRTYSPTLDKGKAYKLFASIQTENCTTNTAESTLFIPGDTVTSDSSIILGEVGDGILGKSLKIPLEVYRGDTGKRTIQVKLSDDSNKKYAEASFQIKERFTGIDIDLPLFLKEGCIKEEEDLVLFVDGLGVKEEQKLSLIGPFCEEEKKIGEIISSFKVEENITSGKPFEVKVTLTNTGLEESVKVIVYVYRGNKRFTEELEKEVVVQEDGVRVLFFHPFFEAEEGWYKVKMKLHKEGRKTSDDLTEDIFLKEKKVEVQEEVINYTVPKITSNVVYESESSAEKLPMFMVGLLSMGFFLAGWASPKLFKVK